MIQFEGYRNPNLERQVPLAVRSGLKCPFFRNYIGAQGGGASYGDPVLFCFQNKPGSKERILKIVVGISGASGSIYGLRLLQKLRANPDAEIHLVITRSAEKTLFLEMGKRSSELKELEY